MSYQFAHLESYSRSGGRSGKLTVSDVFAEAVRKPEACLHVSVPKAPVHVYGRSLDDLQQRHDAVIAGAKESLANGRQRAVRKDTPSLWTCVLSHPATPEACRSDRKLKEAVEAWAKDSVRWLRKDLESRGGQLETVVMHVDESRIHLHAYALHASGHADRLHPGKQAKKDSVAAALDAGQDRKTANRTGDKAYVEAMRAWQDSYSERVALKHGLTRLGPGRRRLSRGEWQRERAAARSVQRAHSQAGGIRIASMALQETATEAVAIATKHVADIETSAREAQKRRDVALQRVASAEKARNHALGEKQRILAAIRRHTRPAAIAGGWLRAFWDTVRISAVRKSVRAEFLAHAERETRRMRLATQRFLEEAQRRRVAERQLAAATEAARIAGIERDRARRELAKAAAGRSPEASQNPRFTVT